MKKKGLSYGKGTGKYALKWEIPYPFRKKHNLRRRDIYAKQTFRTKKTVNQFILKNKKKSWFSNPKIIRLKK